MSQTLIYIFVSTLIITILYQIGIVQFFTHYYIVSTSTRKRCQIDTRKIATRLFIKPLQHYKSILDLFPLSKNTGLFSESTNNDIKSNSSLAKKRLTTHNSFIDSLIRPLRMEQS